MRIGKLRQRVTIQKVTHSQDASYGSTVETWADVGTVWADVRAATGRERFVSGANTEAATATHTVRMRYLDGLSPVNHRLVWDSKVLDIEAVSDPTGRGAAMVVNCVEVANAGTITGFPEEEE